jgi:hypothetical protein
MADLSSFQTAVGGASDFEAISFLIRNILSGVNTCKLVKVVSVTNSGGVSPVGFVDIQPLVSMVDAKGQAIPHGTIHKCPYFRLQGGANAVILDPQVGDLGIAVFADRDISAATATKGVNVPGSFRQFDAADGLYIGGVLNGTPSQYVQFSASGITIHTPGDLTLTATGAINATAGTSVSITAGTSITIDAASAALNTSGGVAIASSTLTHNGVNIGATHVHGGVQTGGSNTAVPH